jgi:hypothetical protein
MKSQDNWKSGHHTCGTRAGPDFGPTVHHKGTVAHGGLVDGLPGQIEARMFDNLSGPFDCQDVVACVQRDEDPPSILLMSEPKDSAPLVNTLDLSFHGLGVRGLDRGADPVCSSNRFVEFVRVEADVEMRPVFPLALGGASSRSKAARRSLRRITANRRSLVSNETHRRCPPL